MAGDSLSKQVKQEFKKYQDYLEEILEAFDKRADDLYHKEKKSHDKAKLAEDEEHANQIVSDLKKELTDTLTELKQTLEVQDKRFMRYIEKLVSRFEQAKTMQEIEDQIKEI